MRGTRIKWTSSTTTAFIFCLDLLHVIEPLLCFPNKSTNSKSALSLIQFHIGIFVFFADFLYLWMFIKASQNLHQTMLKSILRCNIKFFESTPVGRIMNRFSKDIEVLETKIPEAFKNAIRNGFQVITILFVISLTFPFILIAFIPIFLLYFYIQVWKWKKRKKTPVI